MLLKTHTGCYKERHCLHEYYFGKVPRVECKPLLLTVFELITRKVMWDAKTFPKASENGFVCVCVCASCRFRWCSAGWSQNFKRHVERENDRKLFVVSCAVEGSKLQSFFLGRLVEQRTRRRRVGLGSLSRFCGRAAQVTRGQKKFCPFGCHLWHTGDTFAQRTQSFCDSAWGFSQGMWCFAKSCCGACTWKEVCCTGHEGVVAWSHYRQNCCSVSLSSLLFVKGTLTNVLQTKISTQLSVCMTDDWRSNVFVLCIQVFRCPGAHDTRSV